MTWLTSPATVPPPEAFLAIESIVISIPASPEQGCNRAANYARFTPPDIVAARTPQASIRVGVGWRTRCIVDSFVKQSGTTYTLYNILYFSLSWVLVLGFGAGLESF